MCPSNKSKSKKTKSKSESFNTKKLNSDIPQAIQSSAETLLDEIAINNPQLSELQAARLQEIEDTESAKLLAQENIKYTDSSPPQTYVDAEKQEITALGEGNCLLNAFILAAKDAIAHGELDENQKDNLATNKKKTDENQKDNLATNKKKTEARDNWVKFFTSNNIQTNSGSTSNPWTWNKIKQYFAQHITGQQKESLQRQLSPLLRSYLFNKESPYTSGFKMLFYTPLSSEFERYLEGKEASSASSTDTFIGFQPLTDFFQHLKNNVAPEKRQRTLRTQWNNKLHQEYLTYLGTVGTPLGATELQFLGEVFGFDCHYSTKGDSRKTSLNTAYGRLVSVAQMSESSIQTLKSYGIILEQDGTYFFQKIPDENTLLEMLGPVSDLVDPADKLTIDTCKTIEDFKQLIESFEEITINALQQRNILQKNKEIFSDHTDDILALRLQQIPERDIILRDYHTQYIAIPAIELIYYPGQNPSSAHWNTGNRYGTLVEIDHKPSSANAAHDESSDEPKGRDKNKLNKKSSNYELTKLGYLCTVTISNLNNFTSKFVWDKIPMFAVITGKNGIGKTQLFNAILMGFENCIDNQRHSVKLFFNLRYATVVKLSSSSSPQIFAVSSTDDLRRNTHEKSTQIHTQNLDDQFKDLKNYDVARRFNNTYELKYRDLEATYKKVVSIAEKNPPPITDNQDYYFAFYEKVKKLFEDEMGRHISTYGDLKKYAFYLMENFSLEVLNNYLKSCGFKYIISDQCFDKSSKKFTRFVLRKPGSNIDVDNGHLSPGEKLELLTLLWSFEMSTYKSDASGNGAVLLLDEPDSHLHPELTQSVIQIIQERLVKQQGIQVIMTTHSPTTVSLVPKECLYIMSAPEDSNVVTIKPAQSKQQAIQLLTASFVYVNEPFAVIFVEGEKDKSFYTVVTRLLGHTRKVNMQIVFKVHGLGDNHDLSNCSIIEALIEKMTRAEKPESLSQGEQQPLSQFVFGLIDGDNKKKPVLINLKALKRYSVENYIFDPINVFLCLYFIREECKNDPAFELSLKKCLESFETLFKLPKSNTASLVELMYPRHLQFIIDIFSLMLKEKLNEAFRFINTGFLKCMD